MAISRKTRNTTPRRKSRASTRAGSPRSKCKLASAQIVDVAKAGAQANGRIIFGATVDLADEDSGDELTYQIVGEDEADIKKGLLSFASPIARALIGKSEGDVVDVDVPGGKRTLEVVEVALPLMPRRAGGGVSRRPCPDWADRAWPYDRSAVRRLHPAASQACSTSALKDALSSATSLTLTSS